MKKGPIMLMNSVIVVDSQKKKNVAQQGNVSSLSFRNKGGGLHVHDRF